jgi:hypothetical protein
LKGTVKTMGKFDAVIIGAIVITVGLICYALGDWLRGRDDEALIRQYETELDRRPAQVMPPEIAHEPRPDETITIQALPMDQTDTAPDLTGCGSCAVNTGPAPCQECGMTVNVDAFIAQLQADNDAFLQQFPSA